MPEDIPPTQAQVAQVAVSAPTPSIKSQILAFVGGKLFHTLYHSVLAGAVTFITANSFVPGKSWWIGLIGACIGGLSVGLKEYISE